MLALHCKSKSDVMGQAGEKTKAKEIPMITNPSAIKGVTVCLTDWLPLPVSLSLTPPPPPPPPLSVVSSGRVSRLEEF